MSQTKIFLAIFIIIGFAGVGYFTFKPGSMSTLNTQVAKESTGVSSPAIETSGKKMSFSEFMKQGGSYKCVVNQYVNNIETKGVTYISNGRIRGEFNTKVNGYNIDSTLIVRDGYTYTWTSMAPTMGFKIKAVSEELTNKNTETSGTYSFDAKQIGDYDCQPWLLDNSKFTPPVDVKFTELNTKK